MDILITGDGSPTLYDPAHESYHSHHGAYQETRHVFVAQGLDEYIADNPTPDPLVIAEIGFGTGLNAAVAWQIARDHRIQVHFVTCEPYPLDDDIWGRFGGALMAFSPELAAYHAALRDAVWGGTSVLDDFFLITKLQRPAQTVPWTGPIHLIWMDAFSPNIAPDLWTATTLGPLIDALVPGGILTTYCAKGAVRRLFQELGLEVQQLPGPPGKRQMLRGIKPVPKI